MMQLHLVQFGTYSVTLRLLDQQEVTVDLTGATQITFQAETTGKTIGPLTCTVTDAVNGEIDVPITDSDLDTLGSYNMEVQVEFGSIVISGNGTLIVGEHPMSPVVVTKDDTPSFTVTLPGEDLTGKTVAAFKGSSPDVTDTAIAGTVTAPGAGGVDEVDIDLAAADTAAAGTQYIRLTVDGISTTLVKLITQEGLI